MEQVDQQTDKTDADINGDKISTNNTSTVDANEETKMNV